MPSQTPSTRISTSSPLGPPPYSSADIAGSSSRSTPARDNRIIIEPSFSDSPHGRIITDSTRGRDRENSMNMDRKRRLTATASDDATPHRRPSALSGPNSLSRSRLQQDRPLPMLPVGDNYIRSGLPGSSRENAIDLTSSSSDRPDISGTLSRQHTRSLTTVPQRSRQDLVEYPLPRWQPDSEVTHCPICGSQFSFWYRKHHCRKCGRVVCAACSPHRITIPRQYIVKPPELVDNPVSERPLYHSPGHSRDSDRGATSAVGEIHDTSTIVTARPEISHLNPALGGGEEVRLCNPCVPDPNPDPPLTYGSVQASFDRLPNSNWGATMPAIPISQRLHQVRRSLSGAQIFNPRRDVEREAQDSQRRHQTLTSHQSGPAEFEYHNNTFDPSGTRPRRVRSIVDSDRPLPSHPTHQVQVDERDICPICSTRLPPRGDDGNEDEREAHVRDCIARSSGADGSSPGLHSPQSQHLLRMLSFTATEKDCLSEDGTPQECTICMEEYEVGDKLARLECLCKFHKACIVGWFERKKECPVHKFT
ncbi:hypothetical protein UA08_01200 [Talaromyces atroroseus]|uniref:RING-type E3 ubiquitin transferase n=1 Tax=Talaromyces atroroseus TaxID=1441469 RepID=A0A1Q5QC71_TALAT|nr:hypothetical protein UA08_01200 [Talaromyces atroroseus]OKL63535.1 hypothetical protein UA08_01200 [Talaromyces atroroseus]